MNVRRPPLLLSLLTLCFGVFALLVLSSSAQAGPVTVEPGGWPYVKLGIYQGVAALSVNGTSVIELGANGKDLATGTSDDIAVRPNAIAAGSAAIFTSSNGATRLKVPGRVCLYPSGVSSPAVCNNQWPSGGGSLWTTTADSNGFTTLIPLPNGTTQQGVALGSGSSPITGGTALTIQQTETNYPIYAFQATNMTSGNPAAQFLGDVALNGVLSIGGTWKINNIEVYHPRGVNGFASAIPGNEGAGSGLDADLLDGYNVTILPGQKCNSMACLCFTLGAGNVKCAAMSNRY